MTTRRNFFKLFPAAGALLGLGAARDIKAREPESALGFHKLLSQKGAPKVSELWQQRELEMSSLKSDLAGARARINLLEQTNERLMLTRHDMGQQIEKMQSALDGNYL